ncbi:MAG: ABC transporter permease [Anaerolineae bacterium]|nr:ABC transporter permease [Thermoflexales bacterium]MDW8407884.1 ABC transporter permease [Anaerolineae bacterium]
MNTTRFMWRSGWITIVVVVVGLFGAWVLLNAVIGGRCDAACVVGSLSQALRLATPIAFAALCGVICERAGVVDIGIEGKMLMSAMTCYAINLFGFQVLKDSMGAEAAGSLSRLLAVGLGMLSALLLAMLHAVVSIRFKVDQIISGTVINILAIGVTGYMYRSFLAENLPAGPGTFPILNIPFLANLPVIGPILFQQKPLTYVMLILMVAVHYVLFFTPWGLRTRAVGEHPRAADTLGINVFRTRYVNVWIGGLVAGLGGAWFTLEAVDVFNPLMTNGLGFIGLAAMIFGKWNPFGALAGALIFGLGSSVTSTVSIFRPDIPSQIPQMLPYILTIIVLTGVVGRAVPPAADGQPYEK